MPDIHGAQVKIRKYNQITEREAAQELAGFENALTAQAVAVPSASIPSAVEGGVVPIEMSVPAKISIEDPVAKLFSGEGASVEAPSTKDAHNETAVVFYTIDEVMKVETPKSAHEKKNTSALMHHRVSHDPVKQEKDADFLIPGTLSL